MTKAKRATETTTQFAFALIGLLLLLHLLTVSATLYAPGSLPTHFTPWLDLDNEKNIPTVVSSLFFVIGSYWCLRLVIRTRDSVTRLGWALFLGLFSYFAIDEYFIIHEQLAEPLRKILLISGGNPFFHAWVIPAMAVLCVLGLVLLFVRIYRRHLVVFAGTLGYVFLFICGVIFWEVLGTYAYPVTPAYRLLVVPLEEVFELGMATLLWLKLKKTYQQQES